MANRSWGRAVPYGGYGSGVQTGFSYFGVNQTKDMRYGQTQRYPNAGTMSGAAGAYRQDPYYRRNDRKDDQRGTKRPMKGRSPERRPVNNFPPKKDSRPFKRPASGFYEVRVPKFPYGAKIARSIDIRHRHNKLNIPVDVFEVSNSWVDAFPLHSPIKLDTMDDFHVFHREVESPPAPDGSLISPPDVDYSYSARVMLVGCPALAELYKSSCRFADDNSGSEKSVPTKNLTFLIGGRAKNETSAVGGPWSPSCDGPNPATNPQTLIRTAVRTFMALTGVDLSGSSNWLRFMEIRYFRRVGTKVPSYTTEEDEREITRDCVETVVFFIPNLAHLMPSEEAWEQAKAHYNSVLQKLLNPEDDAETSMKGDEKDLNQTQLEASEDAEDMSEEAATNAEATHYSKLDVASMKVQDLKSELLARGLDSKGLKANLSARLQSALDEEKSKDSAGTDEKSANEVPKAEQTPTKGDTPAPEPTQEKAETKQLSEKERRRLERLYRLGDRPTILIHPNKEARGGRFDCHRVTLHALLEYRSDEMKEPNFEVALFAEQFHEMMQRDSAFDIFKAIYSAPEKEQKTEQSGKVNGVAEDGDEPDSKRVKSDADHEDDEAKVRKMRRTTKPHLLLSFTYFDTGYAGHIREHDMCEILNMLGLAFSKSQMKSMVNKVASRRESVQYHNLTDSEVIEGDSNDVITLDTVRDDDAQFSMQLSLGNLAILGINTVPQPSIVMLGGNAGDNAGQRVAAAEATRRKLEYQFFQIKEELEKTRSKLNNCKDIEDKLRADNQRLSTQFRDEQKQAIEMRNLYNTYSHLVRFSHDHMTRAVNKINEQYDREKAKREAERAAAEASKTAASGEDATSDKAKCEAEESVQKAPTSGTGDAKTEEKDWEVVDTV